MYKTPLSITVFFFFITILTACQNNQSNAPKPTVNESPAQTEADALSSEEQALNAETLAFGWHQLQKSTFDNIQQQNFGEAALNVKQLMAFAGTSHENWEFIRMAMVSMPNDIAYELSQTAIGKSFIKNTPAELFAFSRVFTQLQKTDEALELVNRAIAGEKTEEFVYWRARLYLIDGKESMAENDYLWLLQQNPENVEYRSQYATLLNYQKRNQDAIALLSGFEDVELLFRHIIILLQQEKTAEAEAKFAQLKSLSQIEDMTDKQKTTVGELAFWMDDNEFSLDLLQSVKSGDAINEAKLLMANVLVDEKAYDRAGVLFRQVQNGPEELAIKAYLQEIALYNIQSDYDTALSTADMGLRMFNDDADLLYARAMLYGQLKNLAALEKDLQKILIDDPDNAEALNALGYTWADENINLDQAFDYISKAHAMDPENSAILDSMGWIYYRQGDLDLAEKYLRMAIEQNPQEKESYEHLIEVLQAAGDEQGMEQVQQDAERLFDNQE